MSSIASDDGNGEQSSRVPTDCNSSFGQGYGYAGPYTSQVRDRKPRASSTAGDDRDSSPGGTGSGGGKTGGSRTGFGTIGRPQPLAPIGPGGGGSGGGNSGNSPVGGSSGGSGGGPHGGVIGAGSLVVAAGVAGASTASSGSGRGHGLGTVSIRIPPPPPVTLPSPQARTPGTGHSSGGVPATTPLGSAATPTGAGHGYYVTPTNATHGGGGSHRPRDMHPPNNTTVPDSPPGVSPPAGLPLALGAAGVGSDVEIGSGHLAVGALPLDGIAAVHAQVASGIGSGDRRRSGGAGAANKSPRSEVAMTAPPLLHAASNGPPFVVSGLGPTREGSRNEASYIATRTVGALTMDGALGYGGGAGGAKAGAVADDDDGPDSHRRDSNDSSSGDDECNCAAACSGTGSGSDFTCGCGWLRFFRNSRFLVVSIAVLAIAGLIAQFVFQRAQQLERSRGEFVAQCEADRSFVANYLAGSLGSLRSMRAFIETVVHYHRDHDPADPQPLAAPDHLSYNLFRDYYVLTRVDDARFTTETDPIALIGWAPVVNETSRRAWELQWLPPNRTMTFLNMSDPVVLGAPPHLYPVPYVCPNSIGFMPIQYIQPDMIYNHSTEIYRGLDVVTSLLSIPSSLTGSGGGAGGGSAGGSGGGYDDDDDITAAQRSVLLGGGAVFPTALQGEMGITVLLPVHRHKHVLPVTGTGTERLYLEAEATHSDGAANSTLGMVFGIVSTKSVLGAALNSSRGADDVHLQLWFTRQPTQVVASTLPGGPQAGSQPDDATADFEFAGAAFTLQCVPSGPLYWEQSALFGMTIAMFVVVVVAVVFSLRMVAHSELATAKAREAQSAAHQLKASNSQLETAQRVAEAANRSKSSLMSFICHELRNPLHIQNAMIDLLQETNDDRPVEEREHLQTIRSTADLMLFIVNDVLDINRIDEGKLKFESLAFNLPAFMNGLAHAMAPAALQRRIKLALSMDPRAPQYVIGDVHRCRQVLTNLLQNAIKFTKAGTVKLGVVVLSGPSTVAAPGAGASGGSNTGGAAGHAVTSGRGSHPHTGPHHQPNPPPRSDRGPILNSGVGQNLSNGPESGPHPRSRQHHLKLQNPHMVATAKSGGVGPATARPNIVQLEFFVEDTGIGIAPEVLNNLFSPFEQGPAHIAREFGGSGLGLSIVHRIVGLMGGTVTVESQLHVGSVFRVRLALEVTSGPSLDAAGTSTDVKVWTTPMPAKRRGVAGANKHDAFAMSSATPSPPASAGGGLGSIGSSPQQHGALPHALSHPSSSSAVSAAPPSHGTPTVASASAVATITGPVGATTTTTASGSGHPPPPPIITIAGVSATAATANTISSTASGSGTPSGNTTGSSAPAGSSGGGGGSGNSTPVNAAAAAVAASATGGGAPGFGRSAPPIRRTLAVGSPITNQIAPQPLPAFPTSAGTLTVATTNASASVSGGGPTTPTGACFAGDANATTAAAAAVAATAVAASSSSTVGAMSDSHLRTAAVGALSSMPPSSSLTIDGGPEDDVSTHHPQAGGGAGGSASSAPHSKLSTPTSQTTVLTLNLANAPGGVSQPVMRRSASAAASATAAALPRDSFVGRDSSAATPLGAGAVAVVVEPGMAGAHGGGGGSAPASGGVELAVNGSPLTATRQMAAVASGGPARTALKITTPVPSATIGGSTAPLVTQGTAGVTSTELAVGADQTGGQLPGMIRMSPTDASSPAAPHSFAASHVAAPASAAHPQPPPAASFMQPRRSVTAMSGATVVNLQSQIPLSSISSSSGVGAPGASSAAAVAKAMLQPLISRADISLPTGNAMKFSRNTKPHDDLSRFGSHATLVRLQVAPAPAGMFAGIASPPPPQPLPEPHVAPLPVAQAPAAGPVHAATATSSATPVTAATTHTTPTATPATGASVGHHPAPAPGVPVSMSATAARASAGLNIGVSRPDAPHILIVDDNAPNCMVLTRMLKQYSTHVAYNGKLAIDAVVDAEHVQRRPFQLILMDINMPIMDGWTAVRRLRAMGVTCPVVALTANALAEDQQKCIAAGFNGFMSKPFNKNDILRLVAAMIPPDDGAGPGGAAAAAAGPSSTNTSSAYAGSGVASATASAAASPVLVASTPAPASPAPF